MIFFNCKVESLGILDGCIIQPEKVVKLLGINIDENLNFSIHTEVICKKVGRQLSALRRILQSLFAFTARPNWLFFAERSPSATFRIFLISNCRQPWQKLEIREFRLYI